MSTLNKEINPGKEKIDFAIKLSVLALMLLATFRIIQPFIMPVAWGVIIAVAVHPFIEKVSQKLGERKKLTSTLFALIIIFALILPSVYMVAESVDVVQAFSEGVENNTLEIPPPPPSVKEWPVIGEPLHNAWSLAFTNLEAALQKFSPQLKDAATMLLQKAGSGAKGLFMFIISIAISGAFLATADKGTTVVNQIVSRFVGEKGPELTALATATIRGVMQGVIGVAFIQSILAAIGMVIVGVPAAGLWAALVLVLAVIQLPPIVVLGPIAAWVFSFAETLPAVLFLIWALLVSGCDGFLKPILMGRGVDAPMLVILVGALGGMMLSGIIGLFVGAVIVAISYTLFMAWIDDASQMSAKGLRSESS